MLLVLTAPMTLALHPVAIVAKKKSRVAVVLLLKERREGFDDV